ncbi:hypothetical protein [Pectobacterium carotovorum]|uniref:hypothetical protein n=1 Tax=Pectobacterium carotovorum TaxID=554 RepID=UPI0030175071
MSTLISETQHIRDKRGKWSQKNVPHKGWKCVDIEDLGEPSLTCEMCESSQLRYIHHMEHDEYPEILSVGCVCASHMENEYSSAKEREKLMVSRTGKRSRWLSRNWKISKKGNPFIKSDGYVVTIYPDANKWKWFTVFDGTDDKSFSRKKYNDLNSAKLAAFDRISKLLFEKASK